MRVRVRHILLPWPEPGASASHEGALKLAQEIREQAQVTEEFPMLARQYSAGPTADLGGLTTIREEEVSAEIRERVFPLAPGEVSPVIRTEHGMNIFQMIGRFDPAEITLESARPQLEAELIERKMGPELESWMRELRDGRYIEIVLPDLK